LSEIVTDQCGKIVAYGGNPWRLDPPDIEGLARGVHMIINDQATYRKAARMRAESAFGLNRMVEGYLDVFRS
jgi:glycosyltransferase involved in cell wall biosynthesis